MLPRFSQMVFKECLGEAAAVAALEAHTFDLMECQMFKMQRVPEAQKFLWKSGGLAVGTEESCGR